MKVKSTVAAVVLGLTATFALTACGNEKEIVDERPITTTTPGEEKPETTKPIETEQESKRIPGIRWGEKSLPDEVRENRLTKEQDEFAVVFFSDDEGLTEVPDSPFTTDADTWIQITEINTDLGAGDFTATGEQVGDGFLNIENETKEGRFTVYEGYYNLEPTMPSDPAAPGEDTSTATPSTTPTEDGPNGLGRAVFKVYEDYSKFERFIVVAYDDGDQEDAQELLDQLPVTAE